jgi:hypothetical protein
VTSKPTSINDTVFWNMDSNKREANISLSPEADNCVRLLFPAFLNGASD